MKLRIEKLSSDEEGPALEASLLFYSPSNICSVLDEATVANSSSIIILFFRA
jgi:hypothetical protein